MFNFKEIFCLAITVYLIGLIKANTFQNDFYLQQDTKVLQKLLEDVKQMKETIEYLKVSQLRGLALNCAEATACNKRTGLYEIRPNLSSNVSFAVECDATTAGGNWTVIQRRQDGSVDFYRSWSEYKQGFGNLSEEFFIGLDKLYALTNSNGIQELLIEMVKNDSTTAYAKYDNFSIGNEAEKYLLKSVGQYTGTAGDSLQHHVGAAFTTLDQDNDSAQSNCAEKYWGAWWYRVCHQSNLNGHYGDNEHGKGINWNTFTGYEGSLKAVKMMIRPRT